MVGIRVEDGVKYNASLVSTHGNLSLHFHAAHETSIGKRVQHGLKAIDHRYSPRWPSARPSS